MFKTRDSQTDPKCADSLFEVICLHPVGTSCSRAPGLCPRKQMLSGFCVNVCVHLNVCLLREVLVFQTLLCSFASSVSPWCCLFCFPSFHALSGMQVRSVEKLSTKTSNCLLPTHPFLPPLLPFHSHRNRGQSWQTGWEQIGHLARDSGSFSWQCLEIRALMPLRGCLRWNSKGFIFWNQASRLSGNFPLLLMSYRHSSVLAFPISPEEQTPFCWSFNSFSFCVRGVLTFFNLCVSFVSVLYIRWVLFHVPSEVIVFGLISGLLAHTWLSRIKNFQHFCLREELEVINSGIPHSSGFQSLQNGGTYLGLRAGGLKGGPWPSPRCSEARPWTSSRHFLFPPFPSDFLSLFLFLTGEAKD